MGLYAENGTVRITIVDLSGGFLGSYAPDGSLYAVVAPGDAVVGYYAPNGAMYITESPGSYFVGAYAPDGSKYVTTNTSEYSGALRVTVVSGDFLGRDLALDFTQGSIDSRITFSRPSLAMMFDSLGNLTYCPNNLITNSSTVASWNKGVGVTVSGTQVTFPAPGGGAFNHIYTSNVSAFIGQKFLFCVTLYGTPGQTLHLDFVGASVDGGIGTAAVTLTATSAEYFIRGTANSTTVYARVISYGGDTAGVFDLVSSSFSAVTYEAATRSGDKVATVGSAYYGPRFNYSFGGTVAQGLRVEAAKTNVVLWSRDLTNAAWVKTNCTAAKDQTGICSLASSASKITATAANATCLQSITLASSARYQTCYIKRVTGSGVVEMTMDNGTTWTAVTVTASWSRVAIPTQTLANPVVGFRIVTSGDAVAIDCTQNEEGVSPTTPIVTGATAVVRSADAVSMTSTNFSDWYNQSEGTFVVKYSSELPTAGTFTAMSCNNSTYGEYLAVYAVSGLAVPQIVAVGAGQIYLNTGSLSSGVQRKMAVAYKLDDCAASLDGGAVVTDSTAVVHTPNRLEIGALNATSYLNGDIASIDFYDTRLSDIELTELSV